MRMGPSRTPEALRSYTAPRVNHLSPPLLLLRSPPVIRRFASPQRLPTDRYRCPPLDSRADAPGSMDSSPYVARNPRSRCVGFQKPRPPIDADHPLWFRSRFRKSRIGGRREYRSPRGSRCLLIVQHGTHRYNWISEST